MNHHDHDEDAARVRQIFQRAPKLRCPDELRDRILAAVDVEASRAVVHAPRITARRSVFSQRWLWGSAAAAALLLAFFLPGRVQMPGTQEPLTDAEIQATREDVELAFSVISNAFGRSTAIVDEQIRNRVIRPVFHPSVQSPANPPASHDERSSGLSLPPRDDVSLG